MTADRFPVSVKGVVFGGARVVLLRNERDEWELPGGKLEPGESPEVCLVREIREELGLCVTPGPVLDVWVYRIAAGADVLVVTYGCYAEPLAGVTCSAEHRAVELFGLDEIARLPMPEGYRKSIREWSVAFGTSDRASCAREGPRRTSRPSR